MLERLSNMCDLVAVRMQAAADSARQGDDSATYALIAGAMELLRTGAASSGEKPESRDEAGRPRGRSDASLPAWRARKLVEHIDSCLEQPIRVAELARVAGLSKGHFSRCFKAYFGQTACDYVVTRKMELARQYMVSTRHSLAQIALMCGMADQSHLTRCFRRVFGVPPSRWRRAQELSTRAQLSESAV